MLGIVFNAALEKRSGKRKLIFTLKGGKEEVEEKDRETMARMRYSKATRTH